MPKPLASRTAPGQKKMSTFLKVSIVLLIGLTLASISLLFIGDFEGRFERVFSTFALFAVFVVLTAIDTNRETKNEWYAPVALIANTYILGLLLIVIWMTPYSSFSLMFEIFWKSVFVIVATRLVIVCCEVLLRAGESTGGVAVPFAFVTSVLAVLSGILFTAPVGIDAFNLSVPDLYWRIATSVLILTALGLSVTLLLRWAGKSEERAARRETQKAAEASAVNEHAAGQPYTASQPYTAGGQPYTAGQPYGAGNQGYPGAVSGVGAPQFPSAQQFPPAQQHLPSSQQPTQTPQAPQATQAPVQQPDESGLLPWPTFADGRPLPAGADGQPDFTVPGAPQPPRV